MPNLLIDKARRVKMILLDVDGVMTTGQILLLPNGDEVKFFSIHDGFGIVCARKMGLKVGIISGRPSESVKKRCEELGIDELFMDNMEKLPILEKIADRHNLNFDEIAFVGDDVPDLPVLERVGLSAAPQNAHPHVRGRVDLLLQNRGGEGAVREFIDFVLRAQEKEQLLLQKFTAKL